MEYNVRRNFKTTSTSFDPPGSNTRQKKIKPLTRKLPVGPIFAPACTLQQKAVKASVRLAWIFTKKKRPFIDTETVKECILAAVNEMVTDVKVKELVISSIKSIPLSDTTTARRVNVLATEFFQTVLD